MYASYLLIQSGYLLQSISLRNVLVMVLASGCNVGRALMEERLLTRSPAYVVRWMSFMMFCFLAGPGRPIPRSPPRLTVAPNARLPAPSSG